MLLPTKHSFFGFFSLFLPVSSKRSDLTDVMTGNLYRVSWGRNQRAPHWDHWRRPYFTWNILQYCNIPTKPSYRRVYVLTDNFFYGVTSPDGNDSVSFHALYTCVCSTAVCPHNDVMWRVDVCVQLYKTLRGTARVESGKLPLFW